MGMGLENNPLQKLQRYKTFPATWSWRRQIFWGGWGKKIILHKGERIQTTKTKTKTFRSTTLKFRLQIICKNIVKYGGWAIIFR